MQAMIRGLAVFGLGGAVSTSRVGDLYMGR
jgi:hypothetical protein